jgi:hypothetical protein
MPKIRIHREPRGRPYMWAAMKQLSASGGFTIGDVHGQTRGTSLVTIKGYLAFLRKAGALVEVGRRATVKNREAVIYRIAPGISQEPEQRAAGSAFGLRHQQLWTALRALKGMVTPRELALSASTDDVPVGEGSARRYLSCLNVHGLVHSDRSAKPFRYRLLPAGNLGPKAPIPRVDGGLYDPNTARAVNLNASRRAA